MNTEKIEDEPHGRHVPNDSENEDGQWFSVFNEKGGDVFLKDVTVVVEDIGNQLTDMRIMSLVLRSKKDL